MGGLFGVVAKGDCLADLYYGTDYHSHLGTRRGGMVVRTESGFKRNIHDISNAQFRSKFEDDLPKLRGNRGIGVISDNEDQPLYVGSHLGVYATDPSSPNAREQGRLGTVHERVGDVGFGVCEPLGWEATLGVGDFLQRHFVVHG